MKLSPRLGINMGIHQRERVRGGFVLGGGLTMNFRGRCGEVLYMSSFQPFYTPSD